MTLATISSAIMQMHNHTMPCRKLYIVLVCILTSWNKLLSCNLFTCSENSCSLVESEKIDSVCVGGGGGGQNQDMIVVT